MILRSITKHVKDQNWFAVFLDFFIVVVGILIAFQITNWNEARQDNLIYQQARLRVVEEANTNIYIAQKFTDLALIHQTTAKQTLEFLENCNNEENAEERLMKAVESTKFYLGVSVQNDATQLILKSDAFLDNLSPKDRSTLATYARRVASVIQNVSMDYRYQLDKDTISNIPVFTRYSQADWGNGFMGYLLNVSFLEACDSNELRTHFFDRNQHATYELLQARNVIKASHEVLIGLGEVSNKLTSRQPINSHMVNEK
jgi:hypothetical protein